MEKETVRWGHVIKFAGAFIAFLIGSGFATGQEILQYFASYGLKGILVAAMVLILFLYVGGEFITAGFREKFEKPSRIFQYYGGKWIGGAYDIFTILFCFMSYVVMIGGAGATLNEQYGLPVWVGGVAMMILAGITVIMGLSGIVDVIGRIGPVIVVIAIFLGLSAVFRDGSQITVGANLIKTGQVKVLQAGTNWFTAASSYAGFCFLWLAAFLAGVGKQAGSKREAILGSTIGAIGFVAACVAMMYGLLTAIPEVAGRQIPALVLAVKLQPWFANIFSIIIIAGIFTTAVPLLWQVAARFTTEYSRNFKIATVALAIIGCIIGLTLPFNKLVNLIYVINGYVGILILLFIVIKRIRLIMAKRKESAAA